MESTKRSESPASVRRREEKLRVLEHAVSRSLAEADSASAGLRAVIRAVCETERWECGRYFRVDEKTGVLRFADGWGMPDPAVQRFIERSRELTYRPGAGLSGKAWQSGRPLWSADVTKDPRTSSASSPAGPTRDLGIHGTFVFPVFTDGKTIGMLSFASRKAREPEQRLLQAVDAIGSQIGQFLRRKQAEDVLRESEERFRATFDNAPVGIMHTAIEDDRIVHANAKLSEMLGYAQGELLGITTDDIRHPDGRGSGRRRNRIKVLKGEIGTYSAERLFKRKDGSPLWVNRTVSLVRDAAGKPHYFISMVEDVTDRKEAEAERARLAMIVENAGDAIIGRALDGTITSWNAAAERMFGYSAREMIGQSITVLVPEQHRHLTDNNERLRRGEMIPASERIRVTKDGRVIHVQSGISPIKNEAGDVIGAAVIVRDVTERKLAEAALHESEERFRHLTELSSDVYWEQDDQYRFTSFSEGGSEAINDTTAQRLGKKRWEQNYINMSASDWAAHIAVLDARNPFHDLELCRLNAAGEKIWITISGEPVFDAAGAFKGYRGVGRDITARRRGEELLTLEHAVTRSLADADSASAGLKAAIRAVCETQNWECGRYFYADDAAGVLRFADSWHVPETVFEQFIERSRHVVFQPGAGLVGRVWQSGQPLWSTDINNDPRTLKKSHTVDMGVRAAFDFPVISDGKTIGVLIFSSRTAREPDERLLQAARVIGSQIGQFLQRKQAQEVLRESEERFRATFENAPVGIMHTSIEDNRILQVNPKLCEMLGYTRDELLGVMTDEILHPDYRGTDRSKYRERMLNGELDSFSSERVFLRKDGSSLWVDRTVSLVRDASGQPLYFIRIVEDITERILLARLREMEHAVTQVLAESATVEEAMPIVLRTICQALGWACGAHWKWNETEALLRCAETWHVDAEGVAEFIAATRENPNEAPAWQGAAPGTTTGGVVRRVWFSGASVWFPDVTQQPDFRRGPVAARAGLRSAFGFPILAGTGPLGVMEFYSRAIEQPDAALLQMVRAIGSQIGQFIQRKQAEDKILHLAQFDAVTGLPNRYLFHDRLGLTLTQAQRNDWLVGVLFVDLDRFKAVNDTYGHAAGDLLLRQVATRVEACVRSGDTVGRQSGDEFVVMLSNLAKADDAGLVAQKILSALATPFVLEGKQTYISASIGIALYPSDGGEPDTLIRNADTAMYRAKEQGRNRYQFFLPQMNERLKQRLDREAQLRGALERDEYRLHYQPKVNLETGAISGFEALLRWEHDGRLVSPAEIIPVLESTGLIVPVGEWVVRSACRQIKRWEEQGLAARPVAVNLSARQFQSKNLVEVIGTILRETEVAPGLLELELTESLLMSDAEDAVATLRELKALGVRLAVDDFGTGYSSLAYLKRFPLDTLKIDRAFIRDAISDPDDAAITLTITSLAHSLRLKVVAEGVETEGQLNFLRSHGCDEMQGFYFARPLPVEECTRALIENRRLRFAQAETPPESPSVLLVDDNEEELLLLKGALAAEGFRILTANSPRDGFELLARHGVDIVISDYHMPEMTGIEFLSSVRKMYPKTARVLASSSDDAPTITRATNLAGIHKFLLKNWDADRLRAEVREAYLQRH